MVRTSPETAPISTARTVRPWIAVPAYVRAAAWNRLRSRSVGEWQPIGEREAPAVLWPGTSYRFRIGGGHFREAATGADWDEMPPVEMEYRTLGQTDLRVSVLSFGCNRLATMAGDAREVEATLLEAVDRGINFFDTADCYNQGDSERVLGQIFRGRRDRVLICSKAGLTMGPLQRLRPKVVPLAKRLLKRWSSSRTAAASLARQFHAQNFRPDYIERAIGRSLSRLKTNYLDLFLLHCPPLSSLSEDVLFERLDRLRQRGMVRYYGVSFEDSVTSQELDASLTRPGVAALQIAVNLYHPTTVEEVEKKTCDHAIGVIGRAPFGGGALFADERALTAFTRSGSATPAQAAIRLALQLNPRGTVLVGMNNREQLRENLQAIVLPPYSDQTLAGLKALQSSTG
jgi:aryl-alcohol dehydrogenase-like predicted oxidoreductase